LQDLQLSQQHPEPQSQQQPADSASLSDYYHYQDELALSATPANALALEELEQRNAYVVEDPQTGRTAVVEQEARPLPGGGRVFWMRKTAPGSESVTTVISSSNRPAGDAEAAAMVHGAAEAARSTWGLAQQLTQQMFGGAFSSVFAPLNDMLDAVDAQQQQLHSVMMSRYMQAGQLHHRHSHQHMPHHHTASSQQQQQQHMHHGMHHHHHVVGVPCPRHQALMAAAAEAAAHHHEQQQQQQLDGEVQDLDSLFSQQVHQQREQARAQAEQQLLHDQLAAAGLALSAQGAVVPLLLPPLPEQQQQQREDAEMYNEMTDSTEDPAVLEAFYDTTDDDYAFAPASLDGIIPRLDDGPKRPSSRHGSSSILNGLNVDLALLVLLVAATAGMCMAFLQSVLQLREALHAQHFPASPVTPFVLRKTGKAPAITIITAVAGGRDITGSNSSDDELTQPLLVSPRDSECAQEQQQQQGVVGGGVQRFYNPLCYQQLPGGQV
jgi:hypothetical protein